MSMRFEPAQCPDCAAPWRQVRQLIVGYANLTDDDANGYDWAGDTDVDWDSQRDDEAADGTVDAICENDHFHPVRYAEAVICPDCNRAPIDDPRGLLPTTTCGRCAGSGTIMAGSAEAAAS